MKELLLHAHLDAGNTNIAPSAICEWLLALAGGLVSDETPVAQRLFYAPSADTLEIWLKDTALQQTENIICYSRLSFKVLSPQPDAPSCHMQPDAPSSLRFSLELLPPARLYIGLPLSEMGLVGVSPHLVCVGGRLQPRDTLSHEQMRHLRHAYAVLTPALSARLNLSCPPFARPATPYRHLLTETERLLRLAFPGGGHAAHCPLHLSLQPADVPACRLLQVPPEYRLLRFGSDNTAHCPHAGLSAYGPFLPGRHHFVSITMLYPQGHLEDARRLFSLFSPLASLIGVQPVGDVDNWVPYEPGPQALARLMQAILISSARSAAATAHVYCLITPSSPAFASPPA